MELIQAELAEAIRDQRAEGTEANFLHSPSDSLARELLIRVQEKQREREGANAHWTDRIKKGPSNTAKANMTTTVTARELSAALTRSRQGGERFALDLVNDILLHREPEWEPGDVVRDHIGRVFERIEGRMWTRNGQNWSHSQPVRPLKRLVEEVW